MNIYEFDPDDAKRFGQEQHIKYKQRGDEVVVYQKQDHIRGSDLATSDKGLQKGMACGRAYEHGRHASEGN